MDSVARLAGRLALRRALHRVAPRRRSIEPDRHRPRLLGAVLDQPALEGHVRQRGRIKKTLHDVAAEFGQHLALRLGLDAFGDDGHAEALPHAHHGGGVRERAGLYADW